MTGSSGCLALRTNLTQLCLPRTWLDSMIAVRNEKDSAMIAPMSTASGTHQKSPSMACGCWSFSHASYRAKRPPTLNSTIETMKA